MLFLLKNDITDALTGSQKSRKIRKNEFVSGLLFSFEAGKGKMDGQCIHDGG